MTPTTPAAQMRPLRRFTRWLRSDRGDGGGIALEAVLVLPVVLIFGLLIIAGTRYVVNQQAIDSAASSAARAATLQSNSEQAQAAAQAQAEAALTEKDISCAQVSVDIDTSGFTSAPGAAAEVTATVTCVVALGDLSGVPNLPGSATLTGTAASPIDVHQERA